MDRPKIDKPTLDSWRVDDEQIASFLDDVNKHKLNVQSEKYWNFHVPMTNKYLTYDQFLEKINYKPVNLHMVYVETMQEIIRYLPERLKIIREEIFSNFQKLITNRESMMSYIDKMNEYLDYIETELENAQGLNKELNGQIKLLQTMQELAAEKAKNIAYEQAIKMLGAKAIAPLPPAETQETGDKESTASTEKKPKKQRSEFE